MSYDELQLDLLGDQKSAFFVIISDTDDTFNFVVAIMYTQLFNLLCERADDVYNGRLGYLLVPVLIMHWVPQLLGQL